MHHNLNSDQYKISMAFLLDFNYSISCSNITNIADFEDNSSANNFNKLVLNCRCHYSDNLSCSLNILLDKVSRLHRSNKFVGCIIWVHILEDCSKSRKHTWCMYLNLNKRHISLDNSNKQNFTKMYQLDTRNKYRPMEHNQLNMPDNLLRMYSIDIQSDIKHK